MALPVLEDRRVEHGVTCFVDDVAADVFHYLPCAENWTSTERHVAGRTVVNARCELIPAPATLQALRHTLGARQLLPVDGTWGANGLALTPDVGAPHVADCRLVASTPFPTLLVSATLVESSPSYDATLAAVRGGLQQCTLLEGELDGVVRARAYAWALTYRWSVRDLLRSLASDRPMPVHTFLARVRDIIERHWSTAVVLRRGTPSAADRDALTSHFVEMLADAFVARRYASASFDQQVLVPIVELRSPLEIVETLAASISRSEVRDGALRLAAP